MSSATIRPDRNPVAEPLGLVQVMGCEQNRDLVAVAQATDHLEQLVADARVEADRGLVEEQDLRPGDECAGDLQPAALAAAVAREGPVQEL